MGSCEKGREEAESEKGAGNFTGLLKAMWLAEAGFNLELRGPANPEATDSTFESLGSPLELLGPEFILVFILGPAAIAEPWL